MSAFAVYRNLGAERIAAGDVAGALAPLRVARRLMPDDGHVAQVLVQALYVLAEQDRLAGRLDESRSGFAEAVAVMPSDARSWNGLGQVCVALGAVEEGSEHYRRALALAPDAAAIHSNLGNALVRRNDDAGAAAAYDRALALAPRDPEVRHNRALHLLRRGRLADGWDAFAARLERDRRMPPLDGPLWDGADPGGRTIAVWSEQGIGDELMFGTCMPALIAKAGHVVWECAPKLADLLRRSFPSATVVARPEKAQAAETAAARFPWRAKAPAVDAWIGVAGLPAVCRRTMDDFAGSGGYAVPDPARRAEAARWLDQMPRPRVGICWRGGIVNATRSLVYASPADLAAPLAVAGATPVLLQYGSTPAEVAAFAAAGIAVEAMPGLDLFDDVDGVAALIAELDLVISAGTSVAELAGAVGTPAWRFGPQSDWTLLGTGGRPWFRAMRVFTKPDASSDWTPLFARIGCELRMLSAAAG